jgi:hypothetical protein
MGSLATKSGGYDEAKREKLFGSVNLHLLGFSFQAGNVESKARDCFLTVA